MLRATPLKSAAESTTIWLTPAFFGVHLRLPRVLLEPVAVGGAAGEVDDAAPRAAARAVCATSSPASCATSVTTFGIEAGFGQHFARDPHRDRERQDRRRMRLHDDRVAGGEVGEEARDSRSTSGNVQQPMTSPMPRGTMRKCFSIRIGSFLPCGFSHCALAGIALHLVPRVGDGFEPAVLRVRAARLERHHERLAGRVHDRVGDQRSSALLIRCEDLEAHADPRFGSRLPPLRAARAPTAANSASRSALGIGDAERQCRTATSRAPTSPTVPGCVSAKRLAEQRVERRLAGLGRAFAVDLAGSPTRDRRSSSRARRSRRARARASRRDVRTRDAARRTPLLAIELDSSSMADTASADVDRQRLSRCRSGRNRPPPCRSRDSSGT